MSTHVLKIFMVQITVFIYVVKSATDALMNGRLGTLTWNTKMPVHTVEHWLILAIHHTRPLVLFLSLEICNYPFFPTWLFFLGSELLYCLLPSQMHVCSSASDSRLSPLEFLKHCHQILNIARKPLPP